MRDKKLLNWFTPLRARLRAEERKGSRSGAVKKLGK